ncbi:MAG TPA: hypothetical protein VIO32_05105 [Candidatus Baltobacteraceae bacterium]
MMLPLALITLALAPWRGPSLPTTDPAAAKYKLTVRGPSEALLHLRADGLPRGWVASFCTQNLCSPFRYDMHLNERGTGVIEFQAVRTDDGAPQHVRVTILTDGASPVHIAL